MRIGAGLPGGTVGKNLPANAGNARDFGFNPWVGQIPWRRKSQLASVFLPGKFHRQRSLSGYSPQGCKESDGTERVHARAHVRARTHTRGLGLPPSHHYQFNVLWDHQMIVLSENSKSLNSCFLNFNMCNNCLDVSLLETNSDSQAPCKDHDSLCKVWSPGVSIRITSFRMQWPMVASKKQNSTLLIHL